jgi:hypothetical protein
LSGSGTRRPAPLGEAELSSLWQQLAETDGHRAYAALSTLAGAPGEAVPFLRSRFRPPAAVPADRLAQLVADLGNERFVVRENATKELSRLRELARPALAAELAKGPDLEIRRRIEQLVRALESDVTPPPERLRELRALVVLEKVASREARQMLQTLADGAAEARLTQEASAALRRFTGIMR